MKAIIFFYLTIILKSYLYTSTMLFISSWIPNRRKHHRFSYRVKLRGTKHSSTSAVCVQCIHSLFLKGVDLMKAKWTMRPKPFEGDTDRYRDLSREYISPLSFSPHPQPHPMNFACGIICHLLVQICLLQNDIEDFRIKGPHIYWKISILIDYDLVACRFMCNVREYHDVFWAMF